MFTTNKYYKPNSAIYLNDGYIKVSDDVYFYQDFTISVWIKPYVFGSGARIIDFSNTVSINNRKDNIILCYSQDKSGKPSFYMFDENGKSNFIVSSQSLKIGEWSFVSAVLKENTGYIYINGQETAAGSMFRPKNILRVNNYIGKSDIYPHEPLANAVLEDLKIFNRALDINEITKLMNSNENFPQIELAKTKQQIEKLEIKEKEQTLNIDELKYELISIKEQLKTLKNENNILQDELKSKISINLN